MRLSSTVAAWIVAGVVAFAQGGPRVTYVAADKVAGALAAGGTLVTQPDLLVQGSHRNRAGQVEVHDKQTDVIYVTDGEATVVTGGALQGGRATGPDQWIGTSITGGQTQHIGKGDVLVIPAGVPHWFKEVPASVSYFLVKVVKP